MRQCLWHIADQASAGNVIFFAQQSDIVRHTNHAFQHRGGFVMAALHLIAIRQPARTGQKGAFVRFVFCGCLAPHKPTFHQLLFDRRDGVGYPWGIDGEETY